MQDLIYFNLYYTCICLLSMPISIAVNVQCTHHGETVVLICPVRKEIAPIQWERNPLIYSQDNRINPTLNTEISIRLKIVGNHSDGQFNLQMMNVKTPDEGNYTCITKINGTVVVRNVFLKVIDINSSHENNCTPDIPFITTDQFENGNHLLNATGINSPNGMHCTSDVGTTNTFTTDQYEIGNFPENASNISRREIVLCCALIILFLLTTLSIVYARRRHYKVRPIGISEQQNENTSRNQRSSLEINQNIHFYNIIDDDSVAHANGHDIMQGEDVPESNLNASSSSNEYEEAEYIHPYDLLVRNSKNGHEYKQLDYSKDTKFHNMYSRKARTKSDPIADRNCQSIKSENMFPEHVNIVQTFPCSARKMKQLYTTENNVDCPGSVTINQNKIKSRIIIPSTKIKHDVDVFMIDDISLD